MHKNPVPFSDFNSLGKAVISGYSIHWKCNRLRVIHFIRDFYSRERLRKNFIRVTTKSGSSKNMVTPFQILYVCSHLRDMPNHLITKYCRQWWRIGIEAKPCQHIGKIDSKCLNPDLYFIRSRSREGSLTDLKRTFRWTILNKFNNAHYIIPSAIFLNAITKRKFENSVLDII